MTNYKQGDVVLVDFGFSEGTGSKKRPALIISNNQYHESRQEVIIAAITSNTERILFGDIKIRNWEEVGLLYPSVVTGIIRTIKSSMLLRKLGTFPKDEFQKIQKNLIRII